MDSAMEKTKYVGGRKRQERDYTKPLSELPPQIIGHRSKTVGEIADEAGRAEQTVRQLIDRLKKNGQIHISLGSADCLAGKLPRSTGTDRAKMQSARNPCHDLN